MKLSETTLGIPVGVFPISLTTTQPRTTSPFERVVIDMISRYREGQLSSSSVPGIFRTLLNLPEMDRFIETALNELCSPSVNALVQEDDLSPMESPVSSFHLTENGKSIAQIGIIPGFSKSQSQKIAYDFINKSVTALPAAGSNARMGIEATTFAGVFPQEVFQKELGKKLSKEAQIENIQLNGGVTFVQADEKVTIELDHGQLSFQTRKPALAEYLDGMVPEELASLMGWESHRENPEMEDLEKLNLIRATPIAHRKTFKVPFAAVVLHSEQAEEVAFQADELEVITGSNGENTPRLEPAANGQPARLYTSPDVVWKDTASSDLETVRSIVTSRFFLHGTPIVSDFDVEYQFPSEKTEKLRSQIVAELLKTSSLKRYSFAFLVAPNSLNWQSALRKEPNQYPLMLSLLKTIKEHEGTPETCLEELFRVDSLGQWQQKTTLYQDCKITVPLKHITALRTLVRQDTGDHVVEDLQSLRTQVLAIGGLNRYQQLCQTILLDMQANGTALEELQSAVNRLFKNDEFAAILLKTLQPVPEDSEADFETDTEEIQPVMLMGMQIHSAKKTTDKRRVDRLQTKQSKTAFTERPSFREMEKPRVHVATEAVPDSRSFPAPPKKPANAPDVPTGASPASTSREAVSPSVTSPTRQVFVLDVSTLLDKPQILQMHQPGVLLVIPECVEQLLKNWRPHSPKQEQNKRSALQHLYQPPRIQIVQDKGYRKSAMQSILAITQRYTNRNVTLVTWDVKLTEFAKQEKIRVISPQECLYCMKKEYES